MNRIDEIANSIALAIIQLERFPIIETDGKIFKAMVVQIKQVLKSYDDQKVKKALKEKEAFRMQNFGFKKY